MKLLCMANSGKDLPSSLLTKGYFKETVFHITIGNEYRVYAMALWGSKLMALLSDDTDLPDWYPVELFSVADSHIPTDWLCEVNMRNEGGLRAIWGYERLVREDAHHDALQERDPTALKLFREEKERRSESD